VESAVNADAVYDMMTGDHYSWQDVYASYGCSLELEASDDDG
jgi:hypothetical protein